MNIILDKFTDTDNTALSSHTPNIYPKSIWTQTDPTSFKIVSNVLQANRNTDGDLGIIDSGTCNLSLEVITVPSHSSTNAAYAGIVFRYKDTSNYWYAYADSLNGNISVYKIVAGVSTQMMLNTITVSSGVAIQIGIHCSNSTIILFVNGVEVVCITNTDLQTESKVGVRVGRVGNGTVIPIWNQFTLTSFADALLNWPVFAESASNPIVTLGAVGSWEDVDINDPNVAYDPVTNRYVLLYSGYDGNAGHTQDAGLAYADSLAGAWTKEGNNPVFNGVPFGFDSMNGAFCRFGKTWFYYFSYGSKGNIGVAISTDLIHWIYQKIAIDLGVSGSWDSNTVTDAFSRVRQDGSVVELWYRGIDAAAKSHIGFATSTDGLNFTKSSLNPILTVPTWSPGSTFGEPSVYVPDGKEGVEYLLSFDSNQPNVHARVISQAISIDGMKTWRYRYNVIPLVGSWESVQVFDSMVMKSGNSLYLFHSGANVQGSELNLNTQLGVAIAPFPYTSLDASQNNKNPFATKLIERY